MDEQLWQTGTDPYTLLNGLYPIRTHDSNQPQSRQCRLYLLACARREWRRLPRVCRALVVAGEVFADAPTAEERLRAGIEPVAERLMNTDGKPDELREAESALACLT